MIPIFAILGMTTSTYPHTGTPLMSILETRTSIDWRDLEVAKTHVKEAILNARGGVAGGSISRSRSYNSVNDLASERTDKLVKTGGITAGVCALLFFWGYSYSSSLANSARAGLMNLAGQIRPTLWLNYALLLEP